MRWLLDLFLRNWSLKATALVMAFLLWFAVRSETPVRAAISGVEVSVQLEEQGWIFLPPPRPDTVRVVFEGSVRQLAGLSLEKPRMVVPVRQVTDSVMTRSLELAYLSYRGAGPDGVRAVGVQPGTVTLHFDRIIDAMRPVAPILSGRLPERRELAEPASARPGMVSVRGPRRAVAGIDSLRTMAVDLSTFTTAGTVTVPIDTTGLGGLEIIPPRVDVFVPVVSLPPDTLPDDTLVGDTVPTDTVPGDTLVPDTASVPAGPRGGAR